ncbi:DUF1173 domain-containing protein [Streptomyces noursei]|uniref:DUF1173 domain-containing protein n=1 Tax=Streptomyces noursei TaxID=1971 RepID=UPI0011AF8218|nr:DUF1173 domain-containing protein [Streptomyces noursei]
MADNLAAHNRAFTKPLHDHADAVFLDFVLVDVDPVAYVEVYGIRGQEAYERRKRAKQLLYRNSGARSCSSAVNTSSSMGKAIGPGWVWGGRSVNPHVWWNRVLSVRVS